MTKATDNPITVLILTVEKHNIQGNWSWMDVCSLNLQIKTKGSAWPLSKRKNL